MIAQDANASREPSAPSPKSAPARYLFGLVAMSVALVATLLVLEAEIGGTEPSYSLLIAAVALTVWYGGFGPSVLASAFGWGAALVADRGAARGDHLRPQRRDGPLVALARGRRRHRRYRRPSPLPRGAERRRGSLGSGPRSTRSSRFSSCRSSSPARRRSRTSRASCPRTRQGSCPQSGMGMGLVEGEELRTLDRRIRAARGQARRETDSGCEQTTMLTEAAREGRVAAGRRSGCDRRRLRPRRPPAARGTPGSHRVAAAGAGARHGLDRLPVRPPRRAGRRHAGAGGDRRGPRRAGFRASARLYEVERESRVALERILQVAPRFVSDETEDPIAAIAREARTTFGADYGVLWRIR